MSSIERELDNLNLKSEPVPFPTEPTGEVVPTEKEASIPKVKSFLNNDGIDQLKPEPRRKRVSSLSLSDQWSNPDLAGLRMTSLSDNNKPRRGSSLKFKKEIVDHERVASYAFAFDIDGVIVRGPDTIPEARQAIRMLEGENPYNIKVPYIFITNGGGKSEAARCRDLSSRLDVTVSEEQVIQGHTPMKDLTSKYDNVLVVGGIGNTCREVAISYGFKNVFIPIDILHYNPKVSPYYVLSEEEKKIVRKDVDFSKTPIDAILVFADSRNWVLDSQIILELLMSKNGIMGTQSKTFDEGPEIYFAHSDFIWATDYGLSRYGMGALQVSIAAIYGEHTGRELKVNRFGKPQRGTFKYADKVLKNWRKDVLEEHIGSPLQSAVSTSSDDDDEDDGLTLQNISKLTLDLPPASTVYFVGDTPESDIRFANSHDASWHSILVKTGVYQAGTVPTYKPKHIAENVLEAVKYAIEREHQLELQEWNHKASTTVPVYKEEVIIN